MRARQAHCSVQDAEPCKWREREREKENEQRDIASADAVLSILYDVLLSVAKQNNQVTPTPCQSV